MTKTTVLVGFAEALSAPEAVWSLVDAGFRVVAFARRGRTSALRFSRHVDCREICAPETDLQTSIAELHALMASLGAQAGTDRLVLFPLDDKAVWVCSKLDLPAAWILAGPTGSCADLALHKDLQVAAAKAAGFAVPQSAVARTAQDLRDFGVQAAYPIILKAADSVPTLNGHVTSCKKWICANAEELERAISQWGEKVPLLAQSFITGNGEGVFGLATSDGVRAWSGHRRVRMMNPEGSGSSACASMDVPQDLRDVTTTFLSGAGWRGLFMIELLRDEAGKLWFVEINGRPWGSMALCRRQGLEYPAWHVQLALDPNSKAGLSVKGSAGLVCRHLGREFMHVLFVLRGAKSDAQKQWPSFWKTLGDVFHFRRRDGVYNWRKDDMKVFFADFYYTMHDNLFKGSH